MSNILSKRKIEYRKFIDNFPEGLKDLYERIKDEKDKVRISETQNQWNSKLKKGLINNHI